MLKLSKLEATQQGKFVVPQPFLGKAKLEVDLLNDE